MAASRGKSWASRPFHGRARQQPGRPQARVAGQAQEGLGTGRRPVLGVVGLIDNQHRARRRQAPGQLRPAVQLQIQFQAGGLAAPMAVEPGRGQHHNPAIGAAHHRPGRHQGRQRLPEAHGIGQQGAAASQEPAHGFALIGKTGAARSANGSPGAAAATNWRWGGRAAGVGPSRPATASAPAPGESADRSRR
jgi:hypothetical protein